MGISNSKCDELTNKNNKLIQDIKNEENLKIRLKNWLNKAHKECQSVNGFSKSKSLKEFKCLPNKDKSVYHKLILADKELLDQWTNIEKEIKKINENISKKNKLKLAEQSKINQKNCDLLFTETKQPELETITQTYDSQIKTQQTTMRTQNTDYLNQCKNDPIIDEHKQKITDSAEQCQTQKTNIFEQNKQTIVDAIAECDKQVVKLNQQNVTKINNMKETCKSKVPGVKQNAITDANNEFVAKYPSMCPFDNPVLYKNGKNDHCCPDNSTSTDCYLAYCNHEQNTDLPTSFCGGSTCTTEEHANACRNHWVNYGKAEGRPGNPDNCLNDDNTGVLTPFIWGKTKSFTIDHPQFGGTYRWINEDHSTSGFLHDAGERDFYTGYYQLKNGDHALVRQINPPNQLMFIFKDSATGNFKAAQWGGFPNGDLTANLTGVTFGGYDWYNPGITLPRVYKPLQAGQIIAFHADNNRFIKMQCSGCDMQGSPEKAIDQLPSDWLAERFTVVDAGNGEVAFHSEASNCFMRMNDNKMDGSSEKAADQLPNDWEWERFTVMNAGNGEVALHCKAWNRFVRMSGETLDASEPKGANNIAADGKGEKFVMVAAGTELNSDGWKKYIRVYKPKDKTGCKKCTDPNGCVENPFYRELTDFNIQDRITALKATLADLKYDKSQLQTVLELKKQIHTDLLETEKTLNEELTYIEENGERNMNELVLKKQEKAINAKAELNQKKNELLVINVKVPDDLKQQIQTLEQETLNVNTLSKNVISKYQTETQTLLDNKKPDTGTADKRTTVLSEFLDYDAKIVASMGPITNLRVELASTINVKKEKVDEIKSEIKSKSDILARLLTNRKESFSELLFLNNVPKAISFMINKLFIMDLKETDKNSVHKSTERAKTFKKTMTDLKVAQAAAMEEVKQANDKLLREQASAVTQKAQALAQKNQSIASAFALKQAKDNALSSLIAGGWESSSFFDKAEYDRKQAEKAAAAKAVEDIKKIMPAIPIVPSPSPPPPAPPVIRHVVQAVRHVVRSPPPRAPPPSPAPAIKSALASLGIRW